jgi:hypothetical protein
LAVEEKRKNNHISWFGWIEFSNFFSLSLSFSKMVRWVSKIPGLLAFSVWNSQNIEYNMAHS